MSDAGPHEHVLLASMRFDPHFGGVENSLRELSWALSAAGHKVTIVASDDAPAGQRRPAARSEAYGAELLRFPARHGALVPLSILAASALLVRLRWRSRPTRVVARHHYLVSALWLAGYRDVTYVVPTVVSDVSRAAREVAAAAGYLRATVGLSQRLQRFALRRAARVVTLSNLIADQVALEGVARERVIVCPPGVQRRRFARVDDARRDALRADLGLPRQGRLVVGVGRFVAEKGFDLAADAARHLPQDWTLALVGDGPDRARIAERAAHAVGGARVVLCEASTTPERYMQAADVVVLPSHYEPFGQVLLEAVACGAAVAAFSSAAGVRTATEEVFAGAPNLVRYAHSLDARALACAIQDAERERAHPDAQTQRAAFLERYDWRHLAELALRPSELR